MIHRFVHQILTTGIAAYKADPKLVDDLFDQLYDLEDTEIVAVKAYFLEHGLNVYSGYPRRDAKPPFVAIILAQENEAETFLGNYVSMVDDDGNTLFGADIEGSFWNHIFHLPVVSPHPDVTSYLYELVKTVLFAGLAYLDEQSCFQYSFSGADLAPDPKYIPENLFVRQLTFSCQRQFARIDRDSRLTKAFAISGVHIDSSGSPSDVGSVETHVTPYAVGDDNGEE